MGEKDNPWGSFTGETMFTPTNQINFTPQTGVGDLSNMGTNMQTKDTFINRFNGKAYNFMDKLQNSKAGQAMGNVGAVVGGIVGVGASTYQNWKPQNVDKYDNQNKELQNNALSNMDSQYRYGSGSTEGLLSQVSTQQVNQVDPITGKVSFKDLRPTKGQQWANVGKSTLSGATAGMKIAGPWGALVGGAVGGISAGLGSLFGRKKAKKEAERINNERIKSNYMADYSNSLNNTMNVNALNNAVNNQRTESVMNQQANYHALGGFMDGPNNYNMMTNMFNTQALNSLNKTKFTSLPQESKVNTFADGGQFGTTPSYYPAKSSFGGGNISEVNNGGTHEENKYSGVPLGVDNEGIPNLVEEGEVIWRGAGNRLIGKHLFADGGSVEQQEDYVFSNRLKPSQTLLNEVNIAVKQKDGKKKDQKSYADIAKDIYKEQKERPNDPITNNTINANLGKLKDAQEVDRAKEEAKQARKAMANGMNGMIGNGMNPAPEVNQMQDPSMTQQVLQEQPQDLSMYNRSGNEMMGQQYACGGKLHGFGDPIKRPTTIHDKMVVDIMQVPPYFANGVNRDMNHTTYFGNPAFDNRFNNASGFNSINPPILTPYDPDNSVYGNTLMSWNKFMPSTNDMTWQELEQNPIYIEGYNQVQDNGKSKVNTRGLRRNKKSTQQEPEDYSGYGQGAMIAGDWKNNSQDPNAVENIPAQTNHNIFNNGYWDGGGSFLTIGDNGIPNPDGNLLNRGLIPTNPYIANSPNNYFYYDNSDKSVSTTPIADNPSTAGGSYSNNSSTEYSKTVQRGGGEYTANTNSGNNITNSGFQHPTVITNKKPDNSQPQQDKGTANPDNRLDYTPKMTWMRYAPIVGSAMSFLSDRFNNGPDRTLLNKATADANRGTYLPVNPSPIGDYLQYNPFDINYATNKLNAQSQATRRGILNASNGNRATAMANMLGADWNAQIGLGELQKQAYDYNLNQRNIVGNFNKDTNKFNSTQDFEAQRANQQALASLKNYKMQSNLDAAKLAYQMDMDDAQRKALNATTFFNNVGELGRENLAYNQAMSNPALYYMSGKNGVIDYKTLAQAMKEQDDKKIGSKGGTIRRKKNNGDYLNNYSLSL